MKANDTTIALFDVAPYDHTFNATIIDHRDDLVAFDRTAFYPVGGGQPGDTGYIKQANGEQTRVIETRRDETNRSLIWHRLDQSADRLKNGEPILGTLDWAYRYENMKMHTCLHLLCSLIDAPVTGCSMSHGKGRLDFDLPEMTLSKEDITASLNALIDRKIDVETRLIKPAHYDTVLDQVRNRHALPPRSANAIKIIEVQGVDIQPCGGTHLRNTSEITPVVCEKIDKKGRQNRRIVLRFVD